MGRVGEEKTEVLCVNWVGTWSLQWLPGGDDRIVCDGLKMVLCLRGVNGEE